MHEREWHRIEDAPKDGRTILAGLRGGMMSFRVRWDGGGWMTDRWPVPLEFEGWMPFPATPGGVAIS